LGRQLVRRLASGSLTLLLVSVLVFALIHVAPGDPLAGAADAPRELSEATRAELIRIYHLDEPLHVRYLFWLRDLAHGDLGRSFHDRRPVTEKIAERLGITLTLNALALGLMVLLAVPLGAAAAWRRGSAVDRLTGLGTYVLYAIPAFWAGLVLQVVFSVQLDWLPLAGLHSDGVEYLAPVSRFVDRIAHLILPVSCLTYGGLAFLSRFVRTTLIESTGGENATAARARGLSGLALLWRHGFRLAAVPMLTLAGLLLPALVGGSVIVETIFAIPGLGGLFVDAAFQRDFPVLMALTLLSGVFTLAGIVAADLGYAIVDPRIRRG